MTRCYLCGKVFEGRVANLLKKYNIRRKDKTKKLLCGLIMSLVMITPIIASAKTVYPNSSMSSSYSKYYCQTYTYSPKNLFGSDVFVYKFRPIWRINSSNSISSTDDASSFSNTNLISMWKLIDSASAWDLYKSGTRNVEGYYGEGVALGWGLSVSGDVSAKAESSDDLGVTVKASASATFGQSLTLKYKAIVYVGSSWTSCNFSNFMYN